MALERFSLLLGALLLTACPSVQLRESSVAPSPQDLKREFKLKEDVVYSPDTTFKGKPSDWLGRVGVVRKGGADCSQWGPIRYMDGASVRYSGADAVTETGLGYPFSPMELTPEIQAQAVVTRQSSVDVAALATVTANLKENSAAEVILTAYETQRIAPSTQFEAAFKKWQTDHKKEMDDPDICYLFVVMGYSHKTLITKHHDQQTAEAGGGIAAVKVGAQYLASKDGYQLSHLYELSPAVIKDTSGATTAEKGDRMATKADIARLQRLTLDLCREERKCGSAP